MGIHPNALYQAIHDDVKSTLGDLDLLRSSPAPDATVDQYATFSLMKSLLRKWEQTSSSADQNAVNVFIESNDSCARWESVCENELDYLLLGGFRKSLDRFFHPKGNLLISSYSDILEQSRTGPGSSIGVRGQSFYAKAFSSPLTTTSRTLYEMYKAHCYLYPELSNAESIRSQEFGEVSMVGGSRISFAPKNVDISRLIATEPSLNMMYQLGLASILEARLRVFYDINIAIQPDFNRRMAREGSYDEADGFCTIDLKSASDSISLGLCKWAFPKWFYDTLMEIRSPTTLIGGRSVPLNMMSTMGNGFTFPLQTIIFSAVVESAADSHGVSLRRMGDIPEFSVFGDDIIVRKGIVRRVLRLLKLLGFTVNDSKTFIEGPFRESCGHDYFRGRNVRGVYIKRLDTDQDLCVSLNLLVEWSARHGIPLVRACSLLHGSIREKRYVPYIENNDAGIRVPFRYFPNSCGRRDPNGSYAYHRFEPKSLRIKLGEGTIHVPRGLKRLIYNPPGLLQSFLKGEIRDCSISVRHDSVRYRAKLACIPYWDYMPTVDPFGKGFTWQQWETAALVNVSY